MSSTSASFSFSYPTPTTGDEQVVGMGHMSDNRPNLAKGIFWIIRCCAQQQQLSENEEEVGMSVFPNNHHMFWGPAFQEVAK